MDWEAKLAWAEAEHAARAASVPAEGERADLRRAAVGSASWAAGLAALMLDRRQEAATWFRRAADEYLESWEIAPAGSWGRPIAALRCRLLGGDVDGARVDAERTLAAGAATADGPIAAYAAALALLVLERDPEARPIAASLSGRDDFPLDVAEALGAVARKDAIAYAAAVSSVVRSFETREAYLEDVRVADTALVLQALARARSIEAELVSPLLPR